MGESEILAAMLCDPGCIGRVVALIEPRDFAEPEDRKLYQAIFIYILCIINFIFYF